MTLNIETTTRTFSAPEAEAITGVSMVLQRNWRLRGHLPALKGEKHARFTLHAIIKMSVMKAFSETGVAVNTIRDFAQMAILPTLAFLYEIPGAVSFEGEKPSDELKKDIIENSVVNASGRFLLLAKENDGTVVAERWSDYDKLTEFLAQKNIVHWHIFDCIKLAVRIAQRTGLPLFTVVITKDDSDKADEGGRGFPATVRKAAA